MVMGEIEASENWKRKEIVRTEIGKKIKRKKTASQESR